ncbi:glycoside hydrolase family protein [Microvirga sp. P5_D2]
MSALLWDGLASQFQIQGTADELLRWNQARDRALPGLTRRRLAERDLFFSEA